MAVKAAVRFKPDTFRSTLESTIGGLDPAPQGGGPPSGTVYMPAQLVAYDDADITPQNYDAGDPQTEKKLVILYQDVLQMELAAFNGINQAAATALWTAALNNWGTSIGPAIPNMLKAIRSARRTAPIVLN